MTSDAQSEDKISRMDLAFTAIYLLIGGVFLYLMAKDGLQTGEYWNIIMIAGLLVLYYLLPMVKQVRP